MVKPVVMYDNWCGFCTHASICCHTFPVSFYKYYVHNNDSNSSIAVSLRQ